MSKRKKVINSNEVQFEGFRTLYFEDYIKIQAEADELLKLAEEYKALGETVNYKNTMRRHKVYEQTLDTLMEVLLKNLVAEA